jgi:hypothetical protein
MLFHFYICELFSIYKKKLVSISRWCLTRTKFISQHSRAVL